MATKKTAKAELVVVLPGETKVDRALADEAVKTINATAGRHQLAAALEIGDYVLRTLFDDDPALYLDREKNHSTLGELRKRAKKRAKGGKRSRVPKLEVSAPWLNLAVRVAAQYRSLPKDVRDQLPLSHHKLLLPVSDPEKKEELVTKAAENQWSKRVLTKEVSKVQDSKDAKRTGRPPVPGFWRATTRIKAAADLMDAEVDWDTLFSQSDEPEEQKAKALSDLDEAEQQLKAMLSRIKEVRRKLR